LKQALMQFPEMARSVMHDSDIQRELDIDVLHLHVVSAAELMLRVNVSARQWSDFCEVMNGMLPVDVKHRDGGILPSIGTMNKWLEDNGGRLKMSDIKPVAVEAAPPTQDFYGMEDTADLDPFELCAQVDEPISVHGYFVTDAMNQCICSELEYIEGCWPGALRFWQTRGGVDIVLAADGLSRPLFNGRSAKLELGAAKILLRTRGLGRSQLGTLSRLHA
jgi:hypothetical protein